jgi:hypothetical protein
MQSLSVSRSLFCESFKNKLEYSRRATAGCGYFQSVKVIFNGRRERSRRRIDW